MRLFPISAISAALAVSACVVIPIPVVTPHQDGPSSDVQIDGRSLRVTRSEETFPQVAPLMTLSEQGIAVAPPAPELRRGEGQAAVFVTGATIDEGELAARAIMAVCGFPADQAAANGFDPERRVFDSATDQTLFPVATCAGLDARAAAEAEAEAQAQPEFGIMMPQIPHQQTRAPAAQ